MGLPVLDLVLFGLFTRRKDSAAATVGLIGSVVLYGAMRTLWPGVAFLNHMDFSFLTLAAIIGAMSLRPSAKLLPAVDVPPADALPVRHSRAAIFLGGAAAVATTALYVVFW